MDWDNSLLLHGEERRRYERELDEDDDINVLYQQAYEEGRAIARAEGYDDGFAEQYAEYYIDGYETGLIKVRTRIVKALEKNGLDVDAIANLTDLSIAEIEGIINN